MYLLKNKDKAIGKFILYKSEVENRLNNKIQVLKIDQDGEYKALFGELCA